MRLPADRHLTPVAPCHVAPDYAFTIFAGFTLLWARESDYFLAFVIVGVSGSVMRVMVMVAVVMAVAVVMFVLVLVLVFVLVLMPFLVFAVRHGGTLPLPHRWYR
jgi:hypothetical protein